MTANVNLLAVVLAAVSSMVVGSLWYMPQVFGNSWTKLTKSKMGKGAAPDKLAWMYGSVFVASLITAFVLARVAFLANHYFGNSFLMDSMSTGFWLWLGFTATRLYVHDTFEERKQQLTLLNSAHELVTILVMAAIIGLIKP